MSAQNFSLVPALARTPSAPFFQPAAFSCEFPSRSKGIPPATALDRGRGEIRDCIEFDTLAVCEAAAQATEPGMRRTVWAGENDWSNRFRAHLTAVRP